MAAIVSLLCGRCLSFFALFFCSFFAPAQICPGLRPALRPALGLCLFYFPLLRRHDPATMLSFFGLDLARAQ